MRYFPWKLIGLPFKAIPKTQGPAVNVNAFLQVWHDAPFPLLGLLHTSWDSPLIQQHVEQLLLPPFQPCTVEFMKSQLESHLPQCKLSENRIEEWTFWLWLWLFSMDCTCLTTITNSYIVIRTTLTMLDFPPKKKVNQQVFLKLFGKKTFQPWSNLVELPSLISQLSENHNGFLWCTQSLKWISRGMDQWWLMESSVKMGNMGEATGGVHNSRLG